MPQMIPYHTATRIGFPARPHKGQVVRSSDGRIWVWTHEAGQGLNGLDDLGQWAEAIGLGVSFISKLFGGGGPKPDNAARQELQGQQAQIASLQQQVAGMSFFDKKTIFVVALIGLGALYAFK